MKLFSLVISKLYLWRDCYRRCMNQERCLEIEEREDTSSKPWKYMLQKSKLASLLVSHEQVAGWHLWIHERKKPVVIHLPRFPGLKEQLAPWKGWGPLLPVPLMATACGRLAHVVWNRWQWGSHAEEDQLVKTILATLYGRCSWSPYLHRNLMTHYVEDGQRTLASRERREERRGREMAEKKPYFIHTSA